MKEPFGEYIHKLPLNKSLTLTKLAAALNIGQSTLSKIENNKRNVPEETLPKLAKIFYIRPKHTSKKVLQRKNCFND